MRERAKKINAMIPQFHQITFGLYAFPFQRPNVELTTWHIPLQTVLVWRRVMILDGRRATWEKALRMMDEARGWQSELMTCRSSGSHSVNPYSAPIWPGASHAPGLCCCQDCWEGREKILPNISTEAGTVSAQNKHPRDYYYCYCAVS